MSLEMEVNSPAQEAPADKQLFAQAAQQKPLEEWAASWSPHTKNILASMTNFASTGASPQKSGTWTAHALTVSQADSKQRLCECMSRESQLRMVLDEAAKTQRSLSKANRELLDKNKELEALRICVQDLSSSIQVMHPELEATKQRLALEFARRNDRLMRRLFNFRVGAAFRTWKEFATTEKREKLKQALYEETVAREQAIAQLQQEQAYYRGVLLENTTRLQYLEGHHAHLSRVTEAQRKRFVFRQELSEMAWAFGAWREFTTESLRERLRTTERELWATQKSLGVLKSANEFRASRLLSRLVHSTLLSAWRRWQEYIAEARHGRFQQQLEDAEAQLQHTQQELADTRSENALYHRRIELRKERMVKRGHLKFLKLYWQQWWQFVREQQHSSLQEGLDKCQAELKSCRRVIDHFRERNDAKKEWVLLRMGVAPLWTAWERWRVYLEEVKGDRMREELAQAKQALAQREALDARLQKRAEKRKVELLTRIMYNAKWDYFMRWRQFSDESRAEKYDNEVDSLRAQLDQQRVLANRFKSHIDAQKVRVLRRISKNSLWHSFKRWRDFVYECRHKTQAEQIEDLTSRLKATASELARAELVNHHFREQNQSHKTRLFDRLRNYTLWTAFSGWKEVWQHERTTRLNAALEIVNKQYAEEKIAREHAIEVAEERKVQVVARMRNGVLHRAWTIFRENAALLRRERLYRKEKEAFRGRMEELKEKQLNVLSMVHTVVDSEAVRVQRLTMVVIFLRWRDLTASQTRARMQGSLAEVTRTLEDHRKMVGELKRANDGERLAAQHYKLRLLDTHRLYAIRRWRTNTLWRVFSKWRLMLNVRKDLLPLRSSLSKMEADLFTLRPKQSNDKEPVRVGGGYMQLRPYIQKMEAQILKRPPITTSSTASRKDAPGSARKDASPAQQRRSSTTTTSTCIRAPAVTGGRNAVAHRPSSSVGAAARAEDEEKHSPSPRAMKLVSTFPRYQSKAVSLLNLDDTEAPSPTAGASWQEGSLGAQLNGTLFTVPRPPSSSLAHTHGGSGRLVVDDVVGD